MGKICSPRGTSVSVSWEDDADFQGAFRLVGGPLPQMLDQMQPPWVSCEAAWRHL